MGPALRKMKQRSSKSLQTTSLCCSNAKSTVKVPLTFNEVEKTKVVNFNFLHLFSFFYKNNSKSIWSLQISNIPNDCLATLLELHMGVELSPKNCPKSLYFLMCTLLDFTRSKLCVYAMYSHATPGVLSTCSTGC